MLRQGFLGVLGKSLGAPDPDSDLPESNPDSDPDSDLPDSNPDSDPDSDLPDSNPDSDPDSDLPDSNPDSDPDSDLSESNRQPVQQATGEQATSELATGESLRNSSGICRNPLDTNPFSSVVQSLGTCRNPLRIPQKFHRNLQESLRYKPFQFSCSILRNLQESFANSSEIP